MSKSVSKILAAAGAVLVLAACGGRSSPPPSSRYLHVRDGRIADSDEREVLLRGFNLSNTCKFPDETGSFVSSWIDEKTFEGIAALGFNSVRFILVWEAVEPAAGVYDEAYLDRVAEIVRMAGAAGIFTILDMHQDLYSRKFGGDGAPLWAVLDGGIPYTFQPVWFLNYIHPAVMLSFDNFWKDTDGIQSRFREAWGRIARRFRDEPWLAGYDFLNEPYPGSLVLQPDRFDTEWLFPFTEKLAQRIRVENPNHILFFEPSAFRTNSLALFGFETAFPRAPDPNSALAPHLYDPVVTLTHRWDGGRRRIERQVESLAAEARRLGAGLWVGEWAVWEYDVEGGEGFLDAELDALDSVAASWSFWEWNEEDPASPFAPGSPNAWIADAIDRPYARRTAGRVERMAFDDETGEFVLEFRPAGGETEIYLPSGIYGGSPRVEVPPGASFSFDPALGLLTVSVASDASASARIRVTKPAGE